jgi:hypothetical protein
MGTLRCQRILLKSDSRHRVNCDCGPDARVILNNQICRSPDPRARIDCRSGCNLRPEQSKKKSSPSAGLWWCPGRQRQPANVPYGSIEAVSKSKAVTAGPRAVLTRVDNGALQWSFPHAVVQAEFLSGPTVTALGACQCSRPVSTIEYSWRRFNS